MNISEQMREEGFVTDSERDRLVRLLAEWEDSAERGELPLDPDLLAKVRHYIAYPRGE